VHGFRSSHCAARVHVAQPGIAVCEQPPPSVHASVVHAFPSSHWSATPAVHRPVRQVSAPLHERPSLHDAPSASAAGAQRPALHVSAVHGFRSSHCAAPVHATQPAIGACVQPVEALHESMCTRSRRCNWAPRRPDHAGGARLLAVARVAVVAGDLRASTARVHRRAGRRALAAVARVGHAVAVRVGARLGSVSPGSSVQSRSRSSAASGARRRRCRSPGRSART
jgi:hypothetical protein